MITLRVTHNLQKLLDIELTQHPLPTTSKLGDWYANIVPTTSGDLILLVNEKSLLSVAIPIWESDHWLYSFRQRVVNLLGMIGIPPETILQEIHHYDHLQFDKTRSRVILGSMNDIAYQYQMTAEMAKNRADLSLSNAEYRISEMPCKPIGYRFPMEVVKELLI